VHTDSGVLALVQACGPTLVLLFAVLIVTLAIQRGLNYRSTERLPTVHHPLSVLQQPDELDIALADSTELNSFDAHARSIPGVRLETAARFEPSEYQVAAYEISQRFREGRVISIDLGKMDIHQAARLVDFCSGMAAMCSGWIFRVTNNAIVLNPPS
jgi:hypothetical protein